MKKRLMKILSVVLILVLCTAQTAQAKLASGTYSTCFMDSNGNLKHIKHIQINGNKIMIKGTIALTKGTRQTILPVKKRVLKMKTNTHFYIYQDVSSSPLTRKEFKTICKKENRSHTKAARCFDIKVENGKAAQIIYYP